MKTMLCFLLTLMTAGTAAGFAPSDSFAYSGRFQMALGGGYNISSGAFHIGERTDHLIGFKKNTSLADCIRLTWFPYKHWGLQLLASTHFVNREAAAQELKASLEQQYGQQYFIITRLSVARQTNIIHFGAGIVYRYEHRRWKLNLSAIAGVISFNKAEVSYLLKQKNDHDLVQLTYEPEGESAQDNFMVSLSCKVAYTIIKNIGVYAEVRPSYFGATFAYKEILTDKVSFQQTERAIRYRGKLTGATFSAGIAFFFGKKKKQDRQQL